jgi:pyridoxamine 5'-phosphate oxidase
VRCCQHQLPLLPRISFAYQVKMTQQDPYELFETWFAEAQSSELNDPNAMALSTVNDGGMPSTRMVLLKGHGADIGGFIFYTNLEGRKGRELSTNKNVALLFHWKSLRRQIRIEGVASLVDDAVADAYFATRSRNSQLGAWASDQSRPLADRATFEARFADVEAKYDGQDVPRPPHWSGHLVTPKSIEFWQDREFRLHERWVYSRDDASPGCWSTGMLYP